MSLPQVIVRSATIGAGSPSSAKTPRTSVACSPSMPGTSLTRTRCEPRGASSCVTSATVPLAFMNVHVTRTRSVALGL